ncbi:MmgE/PrpD family protein [Thermodesulfobacteriota bacterium]
MGVMDEVIKNLLETKYEALPTDVIEATRKQILDTLAVTIGGSTCSVSGEINGLVDLIKEWGGKEESTIVAFGGKVPAPNAAYVNGILSVRLDFDDTYVTSIKNHTSRAIVPTAFAMAERKGGIDGKELITAVALGHDLACRLKEAIGKPIDSPLGFVTNFLGAAATAGRILGLNDEKLRYALGIAYHQISGLTSVGGTAGAGATLKGVSTGSAAKAGILSALLSERGFDSGLELLEPSNKRNFYDVVYSGNYWPWLLTSDMGSVFAGIKTAQKEYPCCHGQHTAIKATLGLLKENKFEPDDVEEVVLRLSPFNYFLLGTPLEKKQDPQNIIETQFSLCWGVASAIVYGEVGIKNFSGEALRNESIRKLARKIFPKLETKFEMIGFEPSIVEIKTRDGKVYTNQVDYPFGSPENPMDLADIAVKFRHCCEYSVKPVPIENQGKVIKMIEGLEGVNDVSGIINLLG